MRPFFKLHLVFIALSLFTNDVNADIFFCEKQKIKYDLPDGFCKFDHDNEIEKEFMNYMDEMIGKPKLIELVIKCKTLEKIRINNYEYEEKEFFPSIIIASDLVTRKKYITSFLSITRKDFIDVMEKSLAKYSDNNEAEKLVDKHNEKVLRKNNFEVSDPKMSVVGKNENSLLFVSQMQNHYQYEGEKHSFDSYSIAYTTLIKTYPIYIYLSDSKIDKFSNNLNLLRKMGDNMVQQN